MKRVMSCAAVVLAFLYASSAFGQETARPREWRQFRDTYPYHVQGVAVSKPRLDGSRVVIVAEPPPHVDRAKLSAIFAGATSLHYPGQWIGYDGWVRDAVAVIPAERAGAVGELVDTLHREMFGTTYKAFILPIEPAVTQASVDVTALNLRVSAADLARWLLPAPATPSRRPLRFTRIGSTTAVSAGAILDRALRGVFVSSQPGLVLCAVSSAAPLANARIDLRQFVLDSDLILGAIRKGTQVVLVGRERVAPVTVLPPLRVETLLQLASVSRDELSQSYERTNFAAGRFDEKHDWAPIYLSPALVDTEYGSLLNITDQLLKSWSMSGQIKYERFVYPVPASYPFPKPLMEHVHAPEVTFNWNTKGAGYVIDAHGVEILALARTGALPVDYLGNKDARLLEAEDRGYDYFSATGDPNLVRVVQYAGLYQVFRRFGITTPQERVSPANVASAALRDAAASLIRRLRTDAPGLYAKYERDRKNPKASPRLLEAMRDLVEAAISVELLEKSGGDALLQRLAEALAAPRDFPVVTANDKAVRTVAYSVMRAPTQEWFEIPLKPIMEQYVKDSPRPAASWIRTPSIVVSWSEKPDGTTGGVIGGHNLGGKPSSMRPDATVPIGGIRVVESPNGRVLLFNPSDESRIAGVVRQFGRGAEKSRPVLEGELKATLRSTVAVERPLAETLAFRTPPVGTRGLTARHLPAGVEEIGWHYTDSVPNAGQVETIRALADPQSPVWILERADNGTLSIYSDGGRTVLTAGNTVSGADAVADLITSADPQIGPIRVHVRGFDTNQAKGLMQSVETRLPREYRGRLAGTVEDRLLGPQDLKRVMAADYDFARARVNRVSDAVRTSEGIRFDMEASVPALRVGKPPLLMRFKLLFRSVFEVPAQLKASAERLIRTWVLGIDAGLSPGALGAAKQRLRMDLKSVHPQLDVDIFLGDDVFIAKYLNVLVDAIAAAA
jgi:hypothetical protein